MEKPATLDDVRAVKAQAHALFSGLANVVGVGITRIGAGYGLKINLGEKCSSDLPTHVGGVPVQVEVVGQIHKQS